MSEYSEFRTLGDAIREIIVLRKEVGDLRKSDRGCGNCRWFRAHEVPVRPEFSLDGICWYMSRHEGDVMRGYMKLPLTPNPSRAEAADTNESMGAELFVSRIFGCIAWESQT